jgi:hypothetical protein
MDILTTTENEKNLMRLSATYNDVYDYITRLFNKRKTINTRYSSNTIKSMLKYYDWKIDKEMNLMTDEGYNSYISNELVVLCFMDLGYEYKKHKTVNGLYYFNVSVKQSVNKLIYY